MNRQPLKLTKGLIKALNEELEYQRTLAKSDGREHGVHGQILTLSEYSDLARWDWVNNRGDEMALKTLRKCAAIAIRALLLYGCPTRSQEEIDREMKKIAKARDFGIAPHALASPNKGRGKGKARASRKAKRPARSA